MDPEREAETETEAILGDATLMAAIREGLADAEAGRTSSHQEVAAEVQRRAAIHAAAGSADGVFESGYLETLRQDWPD